MKYFNWFKKKARGSPKSNIKYEKTRIVSSFDDVPVDIRNDIYIVRTGEFNKWVIFMCPDRCNNRIEVNLMKVRNPRWRIEIKRGKVSLFPSVFVKDCGAHFWLYKNEVEWAFFEDEIPKSLKFPIF